ncbi:MAG: SCP2 sterol-binding domain-containing protein [Acidimicrobiales bacterium]
MRKIVHLSEEWIEELNNIAQSHKGLKEATTEIELVVEYRVVEEETFVWQINIDKGVIEIYVGNKHEPDVWFETDRSVAISLFEGTINPLNAVIEGTMQIGGDPRELIEASGMFEQLEDVFETIRTMTVTNIQ